MDIKFSSKTTINGNTKNGGELDNIIETYLLRPGSLEGTKNKVLSAWLQTNLNHFEAIKPLKLHTTSCIELFTDTSDDGNSDYTFTYEVSSFWYKCLQMFPNREFSLLEKDENYLITFVASKDLEIIVLKD